MTEKTVMRKTPHRGCQRYSRGGERSENMEQEIWLLSSESPQPDRKSCKCDNRVERERVKSTDKA